MVISFALASPRTEIVSAVTDLGASYLHSVFTIAPDESMSAVGMKMDD